MGHWADELLPEAKAKLGIRDDQQDERVLAALRRAQAEIELLAGRRFGTGESRTWQIEPNGLPLIDMPDHRIETGHAAESWWPIPDPVHPETASVIELVRPTPQATTSAPLAEALVAAGQLLAHWGVNDGLRMTTIGWVQERIERGEFEPILRNLLEANHWVHVPLGMAFAGGWWIQLSRRLVAITRTTEDDETRLYESIVPLGNWGTLAATEPRLILARLSSDPIDWAMVVRIWLVPDGPRRRPWRHLAGAIHEHGLPVLTIDESTTPEEASANLLLVAGWHRYLTRDDALVPQALTNAYPREVATIRRGTGSPSSEAAASLLWERLLQPGFDPMLSAESVRHYIRRQASTLVQAHRSARAADHPWNGFGISERYYYKLLARFAAKSSDGRYDVDDAVCKRIQSHLDSRHRADALRGDALAVLLERGFSMAAARKWLQRHPIESVFEAWPRNRHGQ